MSNNVWVLVTTDPMLMRGDNVANAVMAGDNVVTVHASLDNVLAHIRRTYDADGYYADEGSGSLQNYLHGEGYEFHYYELTVQ